MAVSPPITAIFAVLVMLLATSSPAAANLDVYFYDDGASGLAVAMVGSLALSSHTIAGTGVTCNASPVFNTVDGFCWKGGSMNSYLLDRDTIEIRPESSNFLYVNPFTLPDFGMLYNRIYLDPAFDGVEISAIGHVPGFDVATVFGSKVGTDVTYSIASGAMETITVHIGAVPEPVATGTVIADPHFFVGDTHIYDWKAVGVYNHLEFVDHALELTVEDFTGCDGKNTGEYIRAIRVAPSETALVAACDGIYDAHNGTLLAKRQMKLETPCLAADVVLVNGYLNIFNIDTSCPLTGGVYKTISDHAADNAGGWWEVVNGVFTHKHHSMPSVVPLEKKPLVIKIDF